MSDQPQNGQESDVGVGPTGVTARTKGYRLADIAIAMIGGGVIYIGVVLNTHDVGAAEKNQNIVQAIKESNQTNVKLVRAMQEANCLNRLTPEQKKRFEEIQFCKQIGEGR